jgi:dipeptidase D
MNLDSPFAGLEPVEVWRHFAALCRIPRPSGLEKAAASYVCEVARSVGVEPSVDAAGNVIVRVPASPGIAPHSPVVAIQGHLDMVCEQRPGGNHVFERDPILARHYGDWISASGTTLGADNGIGVAAALALLTEAKVRHGPLELIFTVEEETGLHGALALQPEAIQARRLINLDTEEVDKITVGSAAGATVILTRDFPLEKVHPGWATARLEIRGLKGGHSGLEIHKHHENALKLIFELLCFIRKNGIDVRLIDLEGGNADNAIPAQVQASVAISPRGEPLLPSVISVFQKEYRKNWATWEPDLEIDFAITQDRRDALGAGFGELVLSLLDHLPHGVKTWTKLFGRKPECSSNLAQVRLVDGRLRIVTSGRSFLEQGVTDWANLVRWIAQGVDAAVEVRDRYPGWAPNPDSALLLTVRKAFQQLHGTEPDIQVMHGGLECGVIVSRIPGMDAISFGPTILGAHTPDERVSISSVQRTWDLLAAILRDLALPNLTPASPHAPVR